VCAFGPAHMVTGHRVRSVCHGVLSVFLCHSASTGPFAFMPSASNYDSASNSVAIAAAIRLAPVRAVSSSMQGHLFVFRGENPAPQGPHMGWGGLELSSIVQR
jgi:hypothetical protein